MNSKQQILQQENERLHQLLDAVDTTFQNWMSTIDTWTADKTNANQETMSEAHKLYQDANEEVGRHLSTLRKSGYKISIEWGK